MTKRGRLGASDDTAADHDGRVPQLRCLTGPQARRSGGAWAGIAMRSGPAAERADRGLGPAAALVARHGGHRETLLEPAEAVASGSVRRRRHLAADGMHAAPLAHAAVGQDASRSVPLATAPRDLLATIGFRACEAGGSTAREAPRRALSSAAGTPSRDHGRDLHQACSAGARTAQPARSSTAAAPDPGGGSLPPAASSEQARVRQRHPRASTRGSYPRARPSSRPPRFPYAP
jgi:hypothetical protein